MDNVLFVWLLLLIVMIVTELITMGLTTIWFAGGAIIAIILAVLHVPVAIQIAAFLVVSIVLLIFTRPIAVRYFNHDRLKTNVESMIGRQAVVISEIDNLNGIGQIQVNGQEWSARTVEDGQVIPVGEVVVIKAVSGVKLIVELKNK